MKNTISGKMTLPTLTLEAKGFLRKDIAPLLGVEGRTIQTYTDMGLVIPQIANTTGRGTKRKYSRKNVFEMLFIQSLLNYGFTLGKMKPIIQRASAEWERISKKGMEGENLTLIVYTYKPRRSSEDNTYKVEMLLERKLDLTIEMKNLQSIVVVDLSEILKKMRTI